MRIAFVGKGGSGKTTTSSLFARYLAFNNQRVLAFDADINQHLAEALGVKDSLQPLGSQQDRVKQFVKGKNTLIKELNHITKTTPPGTGSNLIDPSKTNPVFDYFEYKVNGISLFAVGEITKDDIGVNCYHGKNGVVDMILNHTLDSKEEYILVDMTAGADAFSSGLFTKVDVICLVVEPTTKSLSVFDQFVRYGSEHNLQIVVVGNKVEDEDDEEFIRHRVGDRLVATLGKSKFIKRLDRGEKVDFADIEDSTLTALGNLKQAIDSNERNWIEFQNKMNKIHEHTAVAWANKKFGLDLTTQIDPDFLLLEAAKANGKA